MYEQSLTLAKISLTLEGNTLVDQHVIASAEQNEEVTDFLDRDSLDRDVVNTSNDHLTVIVERIDVIESIDHDDAPAGCSNKNFLPRLIW